MWRYRRHIEDTHMCEKTYKTTHPKEPHLPHASYNCVQMGGKGCSGITKKNLTAKIILESHLSVYVKKNIKITSAIQPCHFSHWYLAQINGMCKACSKEHERETFVQEE